MTATRSTAGAVDRLVGPLNSRGLGEVRQVDHELLRFTIVSDASPAFRCTTCSRVAAVSVRGICPEMGCSGRLERFVQLQRVNIMTAGGVPTLAGLISAGLYPQQFLPQLFVDVAVQPGITKSDPKHERAIRGSTDLLAELLGQWCLTSLTAARHCSLHSSDP